MDARTVQTATIRVVHEIFSVYCLNGSNVFKILISRHQRGTLNGKDGKAGAYVDSRFMATAERGFLSS